MTEPKTSEQRACEDSFRRMKEALQNGGKTDGRFDMPQWMEDIFSVRKGKDDERK